MYGKDEIRKVSGRRLHRTAGAGVPLLALSLALAGCFGSWAKPVSAQTLPTVTIGKAVDTIPFTVVDVALAEGYFKQNGIDVKEELVQGSSAANAAMVGGSLQFACEDADPLMLARLHDVPVMAVDALDDGVGLQLIVSTQWLSQHPIAADATFEQKMADLNGSIFAEVGTTEQTFYGLLRGWAGLPKLTGYRLEQIGSQAAVAVAIQRGIVDDTIESPPNSMELMEQGYAKDLVDRKDVPQFNNVAYDLLTTTTSYAQEHPEITKAVATAIAQALNFMRNHPDETLAIEQKHFPNLSKTVLQQSLQFIPFAKDGMQSQKGWDSAVSLTQQTGLIQGIKNAPEGVYWTNKYIDTSKLGQ
jgi:ABC-type nitrate/sulfonate/bicarbonate transport system substrate-binding protein